MITRLPGIFAARGAHRAAAALAAYEAHTDHAPALAALLGFQQVSDRSRQLVDGPIRLGVVTEESLALVAPRSGDIRVEMPIEQLAAYYVDARGRLLLRYDDGTTTVRVAGFRPIAAPDSRLSVCTAAARYCLVAAEAWEVRTGQPFINIWTSLTPIR